jgi:hypothetical protein
MPSAATTVAERKEAMRHAEVPASVAKEPADLAGAADSAGAGADIIDQGGPFLISRA